MSGQEASIFENPGLWLAVSFIAFFLFFGGSIFRALADFLDNRADHITKTLKEAEAIQHEAEALRKNYREKVMHSEQEAEIIISNAKAQAKTMVEQAGQDITANMERRLVQATERLEQQQRETAETIRNEMIDMTLAASRALVVQHYASLSAPDMIQKVVGDLKR